MKLIGCNTIGFKGLDSTYVSPRSCRPYARDVQPQEPIHVRVRIRQYGDRLPEIRQARAGSPNLGRLPVGTTLDCYV